MSRNPRNGAAILAVPRLNLLCSAKDIVSQGLSYKDIRCNQFVERSINSAFPGAISQEYNTRQIGQGQGPFEKTNSPAVGDLALLNTPGHVVLITQLRNGKVVDRDRTDDLYRVKVNFSCESY